MNCGSFAHTYICVLYIFQGKKEEEEDKERERKEVEARNDKIYLLFLSFLTCLLVYYFFLT